MDINIKISPTNFIVLCLVLFGFWFLFEIRSIFPILIASLIFAAALEPGIKFLKKFKISPAIAVILTYGFVAFIIALFVYLFIPVLISQYNIFIVSIPTILDNLQAYFDGTIFENFIKDQKSEFLSILTPASVFNTFGDIKSGIFSIFSSVADVLLFLIFSFLFSVKPDGVDNFFSTLTPPQYRIYILDLWKRTKTKISYWFKAQLLLIVIIGVLTYIPLWLLDIPNALFLAFAAGLLEVIPIFGPILASIPAILTAFSLGDIKIVLIVAAIFFTIQQLENNIIYPLLLTKLVGVPTVMVILALVIGAMLGGILGVIIAIPIMVAVQEIYKDVRDNKCREILTKNNANIYK